jgi:hypothetical protein
VVAPKEGPEGFMRGGGFLEQHAWTPHGPFHHSLALAGLLLPLPAPELPVPQQLLMVAEQPLSRGPGASRTGPGVHNGRPFLKVPSKALKINNNSSLRFQFGEDSENY